VVYQTPLDWGSSQSNGQELDKKNQSTVKTDMMLSLSNPEYTRVFVFPAPKVMPRYEIVRPADSFSN